MLKFEPSHDTALGRLLLRRALLHPPSVGHALYWTLKSEKDVADPMRHCAVLLELYLRHATIKARRGLGAQVRGSASIIIPTVALSEVSA